MMHPYRCQICGETTLVANAPQRCPYCGSDQIRVLPAAEWIDYGEVDMSRQSYEDCEKALDLELKNYAFYKCAAANADNPVTQAIFNRLMKQEFEHAEVFAEAMGIPLPEAPERRCSSDDAKNMRLSNKHETKAIKFYTEVANRATEPRIQEIFRAIAEVENEHLIMTNMYLYR